MSDGGPLKTILIGGPLNGEEHEFLAMPPAKIGMRVETDDGSRMYHVYEANKNGIYVYSHTGPNL